MLNLAVRIDGLSLTRCDDAKYGWLDGPRRLPIFSMDFDWHGTCSPTAVSVTLTQQIFETGEKVMKTLKAFLNTCQNART